jgi:D-arabinose 1-dehydrogenase-like Zn-dependent alcohol dehydrogenase
MSSGQRIRVIGTGGLGRMAVLFASRLDSRVTVFTTSADKAEEAGKLGAEEALVVGPGQSPPKPRHRLDLLLNTAPYQLDWSAYLDWLEADGTLVLVAAPTEPLSIPFWNLLGKRRRVMASPIDGRAVMRCSTSPTALASAAGRTLPPRRGQRGHRTCAPPGRCRAVLKIAILAPRRRRQS